MIKFMTKVPALMVASSFFNKESFCLIYIEERKVHSVNKMRVCLRFCLNAVDFVTVSEKGGIIMKRLKVIACEVAFRELCFCASKVDTIVDFSFMPRKLHIVGVEKMRATLQNEIDQVDTEIYDAILLAYGLCGCGVVGLKAKLPIIIPKAHDCISFFLGSRQRYTDLKQEHQKAFYFTSGWLEREIVPKNEGLAQNLASYKSMIDDIIFINTGVGNSEDYRRQAQQLAQECEASFIEVNGNNSLLLNFLNGNWNENDFTIIPANHQIIATNDDNIVGYENEI